MNSKYKKLIIPGLFCLYFLIMGIFAFQLAEPSLSDPIGPDLFPRVIAIFGFILSLLLAYKHRSVFIMEKSKRLFLFLGLCLGYIILLAWVGFIVATICFITASCCLAKIAWKPALLYAVCVTVVIKLMFYFFHLPLP